MTNEWGNKIDFFSLENDAGNSPFFVFRRFEVRSCSLGNFTMANATKGPRYEIYSNAEPLSGTKRTASSRSSTGSRSSNSRAISSRANGGTRGRQSESMFIVAVTESRFHEVKLLVWNQTLRIDWIGCNRP